MSKERAFTLIELLIVIGILAVLVIVVLVSINPAEAQKKARDAKRMKDLDTLQTIIAQAADAGILTSSCITSASGCASTTAGNVSSQPCDNNWIGVNLCSFANNIPTDPKNGQTVNFITGGSVQTPLIGPATGLYIIRYSQGSYELNGRQESGSNSNQVLNDGGDNPSRVEIGTHLSLF